MKALLNRYLGIVILVWAGAWALAAATLPLLPIDETRYLTVAWEMRLQHSWILPTLNFAPYSHKPPLLFWLINLVWSVTGGPAVWSARIVPFLVSTGVLCGTFAFARRLFPDRENMPVVAVLVLAASPFFYIYGNMLMFDMLNSLIALCAAVCVWQAAQSGKCRWLLLWGVAVGFGVLAKGPVILIYTVFPVLFAPLWKKPGSRAKWYGAFVAGILVAAAIGLSWAVPAALFGGPAYAEMIFWKQSAGRMVKAFDHERSALFYVPFLLAMFLPLVLWSAWWRALRVQVRSIAACEAGRFLLCVVIPPLVCLLLISGKQGHYLVPIMPGAAIFFAAVLEKKLRDLSAPCMPFAVLGVFLLAALAAPVIAPDLAFVQKDQFMHTIIESINPYVTLAALAVTAILYMASRRVEGAGRLLCLSLSIAAFFAHFQTQAAQRTFEYYDLTPIAAEIQAHKERPVAFVRNYEGELGFMARLETPLMSLASLGELRGWFVKNPDGIAIVRFKDDSELSGYRVLFRMPYRCATKFIALVEMEDGKQ